MAKNNPSQAQITAGLTGMQNKEVEQQKVHQVTGEGGRHRSFSLAVFATLNKYDSSASLHKCY